MEQVWRPHCNTQSQIIGKQDKQDATQNITVCQAIVKNIVTQAIESKALNQMMIKNINVPIMCRNTNIVQYGRLVPAPCRTLYEIKNASKLTY